MTEFLLAVFLISWPVLLMQAGQRIGRILRDRRIDAEIDANMWRA